MGYTTYFTMSRLDGAPFTNEERQALIDLGVFTEETENGNNETIRFCASSKWYSCMEDMRLLSKSFPDTVFKLHGEGEENGDLWDAYFKGGMSQECYAELVYPIYDESKLQGESK